MKYTTTSASLIELVLCVQDVQPTKIPVEKKYASAGSRTRINCLEGNYASHYTTDAAGIYIAVSQSLAQANYCVCL